MKGFRKSQWNILEEVQHKAVCCTALMSFLASNMKKVAVSQFTVFLIIARNKYDPLAAMNLCLVCLSGSFLNRMRDYMPPAHKQLIQDISHQPSLKSFVQQHNCEPLKQAYHLCVSKLLALRNYHITVVSRFITVPAARTRQLRKQSQDLEDETIAKAPIALEERGTGGSGIMNFLKTVRDHTKDAFIPETS